MISRKEFVRTCAAACTAGLCASLTHSQDKTAAPAACDPKELEAIKARDDAAKYRFAKLIGEIESSLPEHRRKDLLHRLGGHCANTFKGEFLDRYKGDIHGFLKAGLDSWMKEAEYDEAEGWVHVVDKQTTCACPLVKQGSTPPSFCDCTLGWQEAAYSIILGRQVRAELKESLLRGGKKCEYLIRIV